MIGWLTDKTRAKFDYTALYASGCLDFDMQSTEPSHISSLHTQIGLHYQPEAAENPSSYNGDIADTYGKKNKISKLD